MLFLLTMVARHRELWLNTLHALTVRREEKQMHAVKGNSPAAMAGRAARAVRQSNAWKVQAGVITRKELRRWAESARQECLRDPAAFAHWGIVRREVAAAADLRIDGYNPEFLGAKPARVGEDY